MGDNKKIAKAISPRMRKANQMVRNTVKMRGLGPDDPIEWDAFGTSVRPKPKQGLIESLIQPQVTTAKAATTEPAPQGVKDRLTDSLVRLMSLGFKPETVKSSRASGKATKKGGL